MSETPRSMADLSPEEKRAYLAQLLRKKQECKQQGVQAAQRPPLVLTGTLLSPPFPMVNVLCGSCTDWRRQVRHITSYIPRAFARPWTLLPCGARLSRSCSAIPSCRQPSLCATASPFNTFTQGKRCRSS